MKSRKRNIQRDTVSATHNHVQGLTRCLTKVMAKAFLHLVKNNIQDISITISTTYNLKFP